MSGPAVSPGVSRWHVLWLLVFALDATLEGHGRSHQMGAVGLMLLFGTLVVSEVVATRRGTRD